MFLANPALLLLLIVPFIIYFLAKRLGRPALKHSNLKVAKEAKGLSNFIRLLPSRLVLALALILIITVAHPQKTVVQKERRIEAREIVLCLDTSGSMNEEKLSAVIGVGKRFALARIHDLIGVVIFGGSSAIMLSPPNLDNELIACSLEEIQGKEIGGMTPIGEGLFVSLITLIEKEIGQDVDMDLLRESINSPEKEYALNEVVERVGRTKNKVIILLTDGEHNQGLEPQGVFWLIKRLGVKVYFIAPKATSDRQANICQRETVDTGGKYYETGELKEKHLEKLFEDINNIEKDIVVVMEVTTQEDFYRPVIIIALIVLGFLVVVDNVWLRIQ